MANQVDGRMVSLIAFGRFLQRFAAHGAKVLAKIRRSQHFAQAVVVHSQHLANAHELIAIRHVLAACQKAVAGLHVQVVAAPQALAPSLGKVSAKIGLVGQLVLRKAHIAIDAIDIVFGRGRAQILNIAKTPQNIGDKILKGGLGLLELLLMFLEPVTVVVQRQFFQKVQHGLQFSRHSGSYRSFILQCSL